MLWPTSLTTFLLLACQLSAGVNGDAIRKLGRVNTVEAVMRRYAEAMVEERVDRRQASPTQQNATSWSEQTQAACNSVLTMLNGVASNPAGLAICYNIPDLDNTTGVFQADLRLFMISQPTGDFSGVPAQNVSVALQYFGAQVQAINPSEIQKRDVGSWPSTKSESSTEKRAAMAPLLVQSYAFVGSINKGLLSPDMNSTTLQGLVIPIVSLSAVTSSGKIANTTLDSNEATFITGVFSDQANSTTIAAEAASASAAASSAAAAHFILPGTKILIFPVGAIITGVWALLGVVTVAYGTVGRIRFRDHYRGRVQRAKKMGFGTI